MRFYDVNIDSIDYSLHFCMVKTLARKAGFFEEEAQIIAEYSRLTDEYKEPEAPYFETVPSYAEYLTKEVKGLLKFQPVFTEYRTLGSTQLKTPAIQKNRIVPFHYPTEEKLKADPGENRLFNKVKKPSLFKKSVLSELMNEKKEEYRSGEKKENLVHIGILAHSFLAAAAHEYFSGLEGWENFSFLESLYDNSNDEDILLGDKPKEFAADIAVGDARIGRMGSIPFYSYSMNQAANKDQTSEILMNIRHSRNNLVVYLDAARELLNYFRGCKNRGAVSDSEWETLEKELTEVLLVQEDNVEQLTKIWEKAFGGYDIRYEYDMASLLPKVKDGMTEYTADDNYFQFNVYADTVRKAYLRPEDMEE